MPLTESRKDAIVILDPIASIGEESPNSDGRLVGIAWSITGAILGILAIVAAVAVFLGIRIRRNAAASNVEFDRLAGKSKFLLCF